MKTYALSQPVDGQDTWQDGKRHLWMLGLVVPLLPFLAIGLHVWTGLDVALWLGPFVVLGVVPVVDLVAGFDRTNPPDEVMEALEEDRYYRWVTYAFLPIQYAGLVTAMWYLSTQAAGVFGDIGLAITVGTVAGIGINTAHELGHKKESAERRLAKVALAQCFYGHFYIEHNRGHHVRVATPEDPASARLGESFYAFWPRTVGGSLRSAWRVETKRFARRDKHPFRLGNDVLNAWLMSVVLWGALVALFGIGVLPYLVVQALFGISLLEVVNYMEHYGMLRERIGTPDKRRYERVTPAHSWNSNNIATNVLLYHLQRHSDHHANPVRRFQTLRDFPESPVLPTGFAMRLENWTAAAEQAQAAGRAAARRCRRPGRRRGRLRWRARRPVLGRALPRRRPARRRAHPRPAPRGDEVPGADRAPGHVVGRARVRRGPGGVSGARSVQAELVALGIGQHDEARAHRGSGLVATYPRRPQCDEPVTLGLQRRHPLVSLQPGSRTDIEMDAVLARLVLRHLLEEQAWTAAVRVLDGRPRVALLRRHAYPGEEVVPRGQRVGTLGQVGSRRAGVDVAQRVAPEGRQCPRVAGVEGDLDLAAHRRAPFVGSGACPGSAWHPGRTESVRCPRPLLKD